MPGGGALAPLYAKKVLLESLPCDSMWLGRVLSMWGMFDG